MEMSAKLVKENKILIIVLVSLVIVGIVILTNFLSFASIESTIINQLIDNQQIKTEYAASKIESHIYEVRDELTTFSKFPIMETLDIEKCRGDMRIVHQSLEGKISSLVRVDENGNIIECSSPAFSNYVGLNIKNKDYFTVPKQTHEPFIAGLVRQGASQQIIVSAPLFETTEYTPYPNFIGEFRGVLLSIIELNSLYDLYISPIIEDGKNFFLLVNVDTGDTLLKSSSIGDYSAIKNSLPINITDEQHVLLDFGDYGKTIVTSSKLSLGSEMWELIVLTPLTNVREGIDSIQRRHLFSLGFILVVVAGVLLFIISLYRSKEKIQDELKRMNVTLEKFGISIGIEKDKYAQADILLDAKKLYLVKEDDENHAHELFISTLNRGFAGLGIVRDDPREIKKKYNLQKTSFIWLTKTKIDNIPCETDIENLFKLVGEFVKRSKKSVILIDRLDYIIKENEFEEVIRKIHALRDLALAHECIIILSLNPQLIEESKLSAIEAEAVDLYGKHLRKSIELSDLELDILRHVNDKNVTNKMVSYKDITEKFRITKPTTRAKIKKLQALGLLQVEQKGRFKSLKATSAGRRIIK
jgi:DNA-binding MarR family transcriptional regulator